MHYSTSATLAKPGPLSSLAAKLAQLTDQRKLRGLRYPLGPLLTLLLLAKLCGADTPQAIADWVGHRADWLKSALGLRWKRMPHAATFRRLLQRALDVPQWERVAAEFLTQLDDRSAQLLNLDGKTLKGTIAAGESRGLHLLSVQQAAHNLVLGQTAVAQKENEISAAPRLLKQIDLRGRIVSGDALLAQRQLSRQIVKAGGDYLWTIKENHPTLHQALVEAFATIKAAPEQSDAERAESFDKGHGRIEHRSLIAAAKLTNTLDWPFVWQAFELQRTVTDCRTCQTRSETVYGLTSLPALEAPAERLLELTRGHWSIENGLHYRRDVTLNEDRCRMKSRLAAEALAVCNNLALGLMRHAGWENVAAARRYYAAHLEEALSLILEAPS